MIKIDIPGRGPLTIKHIVFDVNGTLAVDGQLIRGVTSALQSLSQNFSIHLLTADTHGKQHEIDQVIGITAERVEQGHEAEQKAAFIQQLGADYTAAIGQGANDALMLDRAAIGICLLSPEGTARETLDSADLIIGNILSAIELFQKPDRLKASLRR